MGAMLYGYLFVEGQDIRLSPSTGTPTPAYHSPGTPGQLSNALLASSQARSPSSSISFSSELPMSSPQKVRPPQHRQLSRLRSNADTSSLNHRANHNVLNRPPLANGGTSTRSSDALSDDLLKPPSSVSSFPMPERSSSTTTFLPPASPPINNTTGADEQAFLFTPLRKLSGLVYPPTKAGDTDVGDVFGAPTSLAVAGVIVVGTESGYVLVFSFDQDLRGVCGSEAQSKISGAVTALAISADHTFVCAGHSSGYIHLYDIAGPTPVLARTVPPLKYTPAVLAGFKEGHLASSQITHVGFVGLRHTAIVSSDVRGLTFYHALGKVLGLDSRDVVRLLGKYPLPEGHIGERGKKTWWDRGSSRDKELPLPEITGRKPTTTLDMQPLPLGSQKHWTDDYKLVAILGTTKLVIVGLKPEARTWWRYLLPEHPEETADSKVWESVGVLAWFPSFLSEMSDTIGSDQVEAGPILAWTWGKLLRFATIDGPTHISNKSTSKVQDVINGGTKGDTEMTFRVCGEWNCDENILAIQWWNNKTVILLTATYLSIFDRNSSTIIGRELIDTSSFISQNLSHSALKLYSSGEKLSRSFSRSVKVFKSKVFLLTSYEIRVGTIQTWADRILHLVQSGKVIDAIVTTTSYLGGRTDSTTLQLPSNPDTRNEIVAIRLEEIVKASVSYVFSETRMMEDASGNGVDRTGEIRSLVPACVRACILMDKTYLLWDIVWEFYQSNGIAGIFLEQIEPFLLNGDIDWMPPLITQAIISLHEERNELEQVEKIIWHIPPDCLDIHQALSLCEKRHLYDALIYIFSRAVKDFVGPIVVLINIIRKVAQQQLRSWRASLDEQSASVDSYLSSDKLSPTHEPDVLVRAAYKIFPYLSHSLTGYGYPSLLPLPNDDALLARASLYGFVFSGSTISWPHFGGKPVLISEDEGYVEPPYPYLRLLLHFDSEAILDVLDLAFEDPYLDDEDVADRPVDRQTIINVLLDIAAHDSQPPSLSASDRTLINIFVARNLPKYPQFIHLPSSVLSQILMELVADADVSTRDDRQLAVEYLLSVYQRDLSASNLIPLFHGAGFYRVLRSWYRSQKQWPQLLRTFLEDSDLLPAELFSHLHHTLDAALHETDSPSTKETGGVLLEAIEDLAERDLRCAVLLINSFFPSLHGEVVSRLSHTRHTQYRYLRTLLHPAEDDNKTNELPLDFRDNPPELNAASRFRYIELLCEFDPEGVIPYLAIESRDILQEPGVLESCKRHEALEAAVWLLDTIDHTSEAFSLLRDTSRSDPFLTSALIYARGIQGSAALAPI
ncbi:hypothetical protein BT69DRAFT_1358904 [Atractiella rhizophila]|nr:hypothetical protein BT69DRAFT_1358904 [Atractiella rhizophila]